MSRSILDRGGCDVSGACRPHKASEPKASKAQSNNSKFDCRHRLAAQMQAVTGEIVCMAPHRAKQTGHLIGHHHMSAWLSHQTPSLVSFLRSVFFSGLFLFSSFFCCV